MATAFALIIGGGVAGGAAAVRLARAGQKVVLIERRADPHDKVCGEFLSGEAAHHLTDLGIDIEALGAVRISRLRLYERDSVVDIELPFRAFSLSRRVLDEAILHKASSFGAEIRRGGAAKSLLSHGGHWVVGLDDGSTISADEALLATGKHDLRGWKRPPGRQNDLVAFKLHFRLAPDQIARLRSYVELSLFPGGYAGLQLVEEGVANLCLVIRRRTLAEVGSRWELLFPWLCRFAPLNERLANAEPLGNRPLAVASVPYGHLQRDGYGPWRLGDQIAVIPSFCGEGVSIALHSAQIATTCLLARRNAEYFRERVTRSVAAQVGMATLLSRALVHPAGQIIGMGAVRVAPSLLQYVARRTRVVKA